jgi:hypothetical protein
MLVEIVQSDINMNSREKENIRHNPIKIEEFWLYQHTDRNNEDDIIYINKYIKIKRGRI